MNPYTVIVMLQFQDDVELFILKLHANTPEEAMLLAPAMAQTADKLNYSDPKYFLDLDCYSSTYVLHGHRDSLVPLPKNCSYVTPTQGDLTP